MRKKLQSLEQLQQIDIKVDLLRGEKDQVLSGFQVLELEREETQMTLSAKRSQLELLVVERREFERNLAVENDNITRSEARQREIKTQKEYQALVKEVAAAKRMQEELESQLQLKIGEMEQFASEIAELEERLMGQDDEISSRRAAAQEKLTALDTAISTDIKTREEIVKSLPQTMLKRYTMLREKRQGVALAEARDGSCLGCNLNLPPQLYNSLFRYEDLVTCPHCQRVLTVRRADEG
ncbi:MAG TPA: C4-type zinc ribbon domain-containing protein [Geobacterales bacterium]|nr:C4-type zinc ribbon domain-containing protein [Geobacterales bacterium]